jgi:hypothetical protein
MGLKALGLYFCYSYIYFDTTITELDLIFIAFWGITLASNRWSLSRHHPLFIVLVEDALGDVK